MQVVIKPEMWGGGRSPTGMGTEKVSVENGTSPEGQQRVAWRERQGEILPAEVEGCISGRKLSNTTWELKTEKCPPGT